jgi:hypothetical protein
MVLRLTKRVSVKGEDSAMGAFFAKNMPSLSEHTRELALDRSAPPRPARGRDGSERRPVRPVPRARSYTVGEAVKVATDKLALSSTYSWPPTLHLGPGT